MGLTTGQWIALSTFYTTYLFFGAIVFYHIEHELEAERRYKALEARIEINELLIEYAAPDNETLQNNILTKVGDYCGKPVTNYTLDEFEPPFQWTFYHSIFFAFTVCSTLGYGNIAPTITFSRYFMIVYALIGMPVNGILFAYLGDYFGSKFTSMYHRYKTYKDNHNNEKHGEKQLGLIAQITLTLIPASLVLIFLPSVLFSYFEGWPYSVSVYYSFVTLSTIGFGDFIPTFQVHQERTFGIYFQLYEIFILIWFVFGLSYILMLIAFIAQGMRSKRIIRLEQQLSENIILTHNRIWSGVTKDVGYLRRILNEVYLLKTKPIYEEPESLEFFEYGSVSCPNLTMYSACSPFLHRKRAFSEHYCDVSDADGGILGMRAMSHNSESDLLRINRERTFEGSNLADNTGDLLVSVVKALTTFDEEELENGDGGIHLFSDSEIKLDESQSSLANPPTENTSVIEPPNKLRDRAASEYGRGTFFRNIIKQQDESRDWTWSGSNPQIQEFMRIRAKQKEREQNLNDLNAQHMPTKLLDVEKGPTEEGRRPSFMQRINKILKRRSTVHQDGDFNVATMQEPKSKPMSPIQSPRMSIARSSERPTPMEKRKAFVKGSPASRPQLKRQPSNFSMLSSVSDHDQEVLENTTIADLIRAIEVVHMKEQGIDFAQATSLLDNLNPSNETPPTVVKKAATAFATGTKQNKFISKSSMTSPSRMSPLPRLESSDDDSRRSSVNWDRVRQIQTRQRSITEPQKFDAFTSIVKSKVIPDKRSTFARRFSAFPVAVNISESSSSKWKNMAHQMKKTSSDVDRRFSTVQSSPTPTVRPFAAGGDEFTKLSHLLLNRSKDERDLRFDRRFSSALSQQHHGLPSRSLQITPITPRRSSLLPASRLSGIPSIASLATSPLAVEPSPSTAEEGDEARKKSRWRAIRRIVRKNDDKQLIEKTDLSKPKG